MSTVTCTDLQQFSDLCAAFVRHGVLFEADAGRLIITLTGGY